MLYVLLLLIPTTIYSSSDFLIYKSDLKIEFLIYQKYPITENNKSLFNAIICIKKTLETIPVQLKKND